MGFALLLPVELAETNLHNRLGLILMCALLFQVLLGMFRGSKGGPQTPTHSGDLRGHHYDMTPWRRTFEAMHKSLGYAALVLSIAVILTGLWKANAPVWMWAALGVWWPLMVICFLICQRKGMAIDTYQAIWGQEPSHPGNNLPHPGWGVHRLDEDGK